MTILSVLAGFVGMNETLPTGHTDRAAHRASRRDAIDQKLASEEMHAAAKKTAANVAAREAHAALEAADAAHVAQLDLDISNSIFAKLAPHVRSFCEQSNRASSREIAQVVAQHETRAQHELGRSLSVRVLAIAFCVALVEQDPAALGAFAAVDSSGSPALFPLFASYNFADTHGSALADRSASAKLVPALEELEIHLLKYSEMRIHAVDEAAEDRWAVMTSSATHSAFTTRWNALIAQQKAEADTAEAPARAALRTAWLVQQASIGNESAQAVAKAEGIEVPVLETLDEPEDDELEGEAEDDELEAEETHDENDGYVEIEKGVERVRG